MLQGETVFSGGPISDCSDCGEIPKLGVYQSAAGFYIGFWCCSPFSRESGYFRTREDAEQELYVWVAEGEYDSARWVD